MWSGEGGMWSGDGDGLNCDFCDGDDWDDGEGEPPARPPLWVPRIEYGAGSACAGTTEWEGMVGCGAGMDGCGAAMDGCGAAMDGCGAWMDGCGAVVDGCGAWMDGCGAAMDGCGAAMGGCGVGCPGSNVGQRDDGTRVSQNRHPCRRRCSASPVANARPVPSDMRAPPGTCSLLCRTPMWSWRRSAREPAASAVVSVVVASCSLRLSMMSCSGVVPSLRACSVNARSMSGVSVIFTSSSLSVGR